MFQIAKVLTDELFAMPFEMITRASMSNVQFICSVAGLEKIVTVVTATYQ